MNDEEPDSLAELRDLLDGDYYLGISVVLEELLGADLASSSVRAAGEDVVLIIGPPRSGKSTGIIIPNVLLHRGAVVTTSTKPDVFLACLLYTSDAADE